MTMTTALTLPEEILQRIRDEVARGRNRKVSSTYRPPTRSDFALNRRILCFDQTLSNSGWAVLSTQQGGISVLDSGTLRPIGIPPNTKGFEVTFAKAVSIARGVGEVLRHHLPYGDVVLELPSVVGYRTESSLVAAATICVELDRLGRPMPYFVSRQAAGTLLCGDRHASKSISSALVLDIVTDYQTGTGQWTEHVRDAVFVGLKHLYLEEK
jgi:hypothetical protein